MGFSDISSITCPSERVSQESKPWVLHAVLLILLVGLSGCVTHEGTLHSEPITVLGEITVRGNVPFHEVVLITDDNNWYILDLSEEQRSDLMTPARARVTGPIRLGEWNGRPFTRMTVHELVLEQ